MFAGWILPRGTFDELDFVQRFSHLLNRAGVKCVWVDKDEGAGHASPDRAVGRAEAAAGAAAVVAVLSPAYLASPECTVERDIVMHRREPLEFGGRAQDVPVVCVDATAVLGQPPVGGSTATTPPPAGLIGPRDPPPLLLGKYSKPAEAAAVRVLTAMRKRGVVEGLAANPAAPALDGPDERAVRAWMQAMAGSWKRRPVLEWSPEETGAWLTAQGGYLAAYAPAFRDAGVGGFLLKAVTEEVLERRLGVAVRAHRDRILSLLRAMLPGGAAPAESTASRMLRMSEAELNDVIADMFVAADKDKSGSLDRKEFKDLLKTADLGFSAADIRVVMEECDEDGDGLIDYGEFIPVMTGIVRSLAAKNKAREKQRAAAGRLAGRTKQTSKTGVDANALLHGMDRRTLEDTLRRVFAAADADGSGILDRKEFTACLRSADLGLSRREINALLSEVDCDGDGRVSIEEFVPVAFSTLAERMADDAAMSQAMSSPAALDRLVRRAFEEAAKAEAAAGSIPDALPAPRLRDALAGLKEKGVGLTRLQIATVMGEAPVDGKGKVAWRDFAPAASDMLWTILDAEAAARRAEAVAAIAATEGAAALAGLRALDRSAVHALLAAAFAEADADGSGTLERDEVETVLRGLVSDDIAIPPKAVTAMMSALDADGDGAVRYGEMVEFFCDVLLHVEREAAVGASLEQARRRAAEAEAASQAAADDAKASAAAAEAAKTARDAALVEADLADALGALAGMDMAKDDVYRAAVKTVSRFAAVCAGDTAGGGGVYVGELREGTTRRARCVSYVAASPSHAFVMTRELRAWEGVSWPALGLDPLPPPGVASDEDDAETNESAPASSTSTREAVVVDAPNAASAGATSLRPVPRASLASGPPAPPGALSTTQTVAVSAPGAFFAAPFAGGKYRGFVALDTVRQEDGDGSINGGEMDQDQGATPSSVHKGIPAADKSLVTRVASAVSAALEAGDAARRADRAACKEAALAEFDSEEAKAAREAARKAAREAEGEDGGDAA